MSDVRKLHEHYSTHLTVPPLIIIPRSHSILYYIYHSLHSMPILTFDLGGTKLAVAVFTEEGNMIAEETIALAKREGTAVGELIKAQVKKHREDQNIKGQTITAIGISVPGINYKNTGRIWAPNIPGWENYPLLEEIKSVTGKIPVIVENDRACSIAGEYWKGAAKDCTDAIFLAVGTGIGAGILVDGKILRGVNDIAGSIGWMALKPSYDKNYKECGCFESIASGEGIVKHAKSILAQKKDYAGPLKEKASDRLTTSDVFDAYDAGDVAAKEVFDDCIELWGMAIANLVSIFNPQKIILGGGVFGPAKKFIPAIKEEAFKWAQPISRQQVVIESSALGSHAGLYGAGFMALLNLKTITTS